MEKAETGEVRAVEVLEEQRLPVQRKDGDMFTAEEVASGEYRQQVAWSLLLKAQEPRVGRKGGDRGA